MNTIEQPTTIEAYCQAINAIILDHYGKYDSLYNPIERYAKPSQDYPSYIYVDLSLENVFIFPSTDEFAREFKDILYWRDRENPNSPYEELCALEERLSGFLWEKA